MHGKKDTERKSGQNRRKITGDIAQLKTACYDESKGLRTCLPEQGDMDKEKVEKTKKTVAKSAVALTTAAALITAGLFHTPADIVKEEDLYSAPAIVETMDREPVPDEPEDMPEQEEEKKKNLKDRFREWILQLPRIIRILFLLPLWCIGTVLLSVLTPLFQTVLPPLLNVVLRWAAVAAVLLALVAIAVKLLFPDVPLKKILSKRNIVLVVIYSALVGITGWLLDDFYPDKRLLVPAVYAGAAALFVGAVLLLTAFHRKREERKQLNA